MIKYGTTGKKPVSAREYIERRDREERRTRTQKVNDRVKKENMDRTLGFFSGATLETVRRATLLENDQFQLLSTLISQTPSIRVSQIMAEKTTGSNEYGNTKYFDENIQARKVAECANNLANMFVSDYGFKRFVFAKDENGFPMLCYLNNKINEDSREEFEIQTISGAESYRAKGEESPEELQQLLIHMLNALKIILWFKQYNNLKQKRYRKLTLYLFIFMKLFQKQNKLMKQF